jgi:hypothetical protein
MRVGEECTQTGFGAKQNHPSAVFGTGEMARISIVEDASAQGDEFLLILNICR